MMIVYVCMLGAWRGYCNGVPDCTSTPKVEYYPPPEAPKSRINIYIFFNQINKTQVVSSGCCHLKGLVEKKNCLRAPLVLAKQPTSNN